MLLGFNTMRLSLISLFLVCIILVLLFAKKELDIKRVIRQVGNIETQTKYQKRVDEEDLYETDGYYKEPKHSYHHDGSKWGKHHGSHHGHKHHDAHDKGHHGHSHGHHNKGHKDHGWKKWHFKKGYKHGYHAYGNQYGAGSKDYGHANKHYGSHHKDNGGKYWGKKHGGHHGYHDGHHKGHDAHWWKGGEHKRSINDIQINTIMAMRSKDILSPKNLNHTDAFNYMSKPKLYSGKNDLTNSSNNGIISNLSSQWAINKNLTKQINGHHLLGAILTLRPNLNTSFINTGHISNAQTAALMDYQTVNQHGGAVNERQKSPESSYDEDELDDDFDEDEEDEKEYSDIQGDVEDMPEPDYAHMSQNKS